MYSGSGCCLTVLSIGEYSKPKVLVSDRMRKIVSQQHINCEFCPETTSNPMHWRMSNIFHFTARKRIRYRAFKLFFLQKKHVKIQSIWVNNLNHKANHETNPKNIPFFAVLAQITIKRVHQRCPLFNRRDLHHTLFLSRWESGKEKREKSRDASISAMALDCCARIR